MKPKIAILIPYFGKWPVWIDLFVESCRTNPEIDWFLFSDCPPPQNRVRNVRHVSTSFDAYKAQLSAAFGHDVSHASPYKLCDFKPGLAYAHRNLVSGYDFIGFGDLDVIYGNLKLFYGDETLAEYDVLSAHRDRVSGHLFLMRNIEELVILFRQVPGWDEALRKEAIIGFDESHFFKFLKTKPRSFIGRRVPNRPRGLFRELYSTPGATHRMRWFWKDGRLTSEFYPHHEFAYLHFMSWHSDRWLAHQPAVTAGAPAPWSLLPEIVKTDWRDARRHGFMISPQGFEAIDLPHYP